MGLEKATPPRTLLTGFADIPRRPSPSPLREIRVIRPEYDLAQIAFKTPAPALTAQVNCAYAYAAASHADAWLQSIFKSKML